MKTLAIAFFALITSMAQAQTFNEWFRQKKTQEKYLLQQIAGFQQYLDYLKAGYGIFQKGSDLISGFKDGEFQLHQTFFENKSRLNPALQPYVAKNSRLIQSALSYCDKAKKITAKEKLLTPSQKAYAKNVIMETKGKTLSIKSAFEQLTSEDKMVLSDAERMARLQTLEDDLIEINHFLKAWTTGLISFCQSLKKQSAENQQMQSLLTPAYKPRP
ncbi:hypothetical protein [Pelobium manganitolerans]|uniref:hypothetical protein n=1 Tax=Pelobium manganitolerans TaxID=1842495 RepID=UPI003FA34E00